MSEVKGNELKKQNQGVEVELGGQTRTMRFDLNAFAEIEEMFGSIEDAMNALEKGSIKSVRALLWASLIHEETDENGDPKITPKQVGSWINLSQLNELAQKLGEAIQAALPEDAQGEEGENPLEKAQEVQEKKQKEYQTKQKQKEAK